MASISALSSTSRNSSNTFFGPSPFTGFLILSTGKTNFSKLPIITENILDVSTVDATKTLKGHITIVCFIGNNIENSKGKGGFFNLNEKVYKKFIEYKKFQIIAIYPEGKEEDAKKLKNEIGAFTDMVKWKFISGSNQAITNLYESFKTNDSLNNMYTSKAFLVDKNGDLRGRNTDEDYLNGMLYGYNMKSVSELNAKLKDDILVLFYEYYAAFKEKNLNKADRKEVGL